MNDASQQPSVPPQPAFEAAKTDVQRKTLDQRELANELMRLRHSCAHILATAVLRLWPDARLDQGHEEDWPRHGARLLHGRA